MGRLRRKPGTVETLRKYMDLVLILDGTAAEKTNWKEPLKQKHALFVELGTGKGNFLLEMAQKYPETGFVGMEKEPEVLLPAVRSTAEIGLKNLRFILGDVQELPQLFDSGEIDGLYIHFCDPWPKSRHQKRRLTHPDFLALYRAVASTGAFLRFKTDNEALFEYSLEQFASTGMELAEVSRDFHAGGTKVSELMTEYEAKFVSAGLPIYYCEARFEKQAVGEPAYG